MRIDRATRFVFAPPGAVFAAFVDPKAIVRWLPPKGATARLREFEPKVGGVIKMTLIFERGGNTKRKTTNESDDVEGRFTKLIPPEMIEQEFRFVSDDPEFSGVMTMTWIFIAEGDGTRVNIEASNVPAGITPEEHQVGMASSLSNLAAYLEADAGQ